MQSQNQTATPASDGPEHGAFTDVKELRRRAREHLDDGAVTESYRANRAAVVALLNDALASEVVSMLRYKRHYYMACGLAAGSAAGEFLEHAKEEQEHADLIAQRITELNGAPDLNPERMAARSHTQYDEARTLVDMVREDVIGERIAIESYGAMIRYVGDRDPTTRRLLEEILAREEEHANDMADLLRRSA